ncbi:MAG: NUDIX domain-containing protein [Bacilli bacterium]
MEYLDIYNENKELIGTELRSVVHEKGLWHKTIHCWLFDHSGNIYFQIRKGEGFYTTASGHVDAGETINEAFDREIKEEIGLDVDESKIIFIDEVKWQLDRINPDGSEFHDRAFANVWICPFEGDDTDFSFNDPDGDVLGIVRVNARDTKRLFWEELNNIPAHIISTEGIEDRNITKEEFLLNKGETYLGKYGKVLDSVINVTSNY